MANKHIVKRHGVKVVFDEKKVYGSVYAATINAHYGERYAEKVANSVLSKVKKWIKTKPVVSSDEIRFQILQHITEEEIALLYKHHLDIC